MHLRNRRALNLESLESRDVPTATTGMSDSFDTSSYPYAPSGWTEWSSNGVQYYQVSQSAALSGKQSVAIYGNINVESRMWEPTALSGDVSLSLAVRSDTTAPILLFGRGQSLGTAAPSYVGATISTGGAVALRVDVNGTAQYLKTVTPASPVASAWLRITAVFSGTQATITVQRLDTQQYLSAAGQWQSASTAAITQTIAAFSGTGFTGVGRLSGAYGTAYIDDFAATPVASAPVAAPAPAANNSGIQIANLAYAGMPLTAADEQVYASTSDLVVANPTYLSALQAASPSTPELIYTNVSNIYGDLLSSWMDYADTTGTNPEEAFYHVTQPTAFSGSSSGSVPVDWFQSAVKTTATGTVTDVTANARGTASTGLTFGTAGDTVAVGYLDDFREVDVTLSKAAGSGYTGVWEYASFADAQGNAVTWKPLTLLTDTTNGLKQSGQITFDPPGNWVPTKDSSGDLLYYVRFRTISGNATTAPIASTILGADYVNAGGGSSGTIPVFDYAADTNHDGYLDNAEWAHRATGDNARFAYQSRLFYPYYGQMRFVVDPTYAAVKTWEGEYQADFLAANPNADGLFLDNENGKLPFTTPVRESTANYTGDSAALVAAVKAAIGNRLMVANTSGAGSGTTATAITADAGIAYEESLLRPTTANWSTVLDTQATVNARLAASATAKVILDSYSGTASPTDPSVQMGVLSYYYLLGDPTRTYLMFFGGQNPAASFSSTNVPAASVNIGAPQGVMYVYSSGQDPENKALQYKVYARQYANALVLYKPLSYTLGVGTGTTDAATATVQQLNGSYRVLNANGTLGPVITSIALTNGQGVVLMKA